MDSCMNITKLHKFFHKSDPECHQKLFGYLVVSSTYEVRGE